MAQLNDNLAACSVVLTADDMKQLDEVSAVPRAFPWDFIDMVRAGIQNGTTVNGFTAEPWALGPKTDAERW